MIHVTKGKVGYPSKSTRDMYQHIPPIYGLYNGCIRQYEVIFGEQLPGWPPKGTQHFPLKCSAAKVFTTNSGVQILETNQHGQALRFFSCIFSITHIIHGTGISTYMNSSFSWFS